jgi:4-hydroxy-tetrahydrodipicolinate reductase
MGREMIRACAVSRAVELTAGVVVDPAKQGRDLGELAGIGSVGVRATTDLDGALRRDDVDLVFYCGLGDPPEVAEFLARFADAGKDAITLTGLVHPPTALGHAGAEALAARAVSGGARIVGAGWNPGFLLDVLPVVWGSSCVEIRHVYALRVAEMRAWGAGVHEECGIGLPPSEVRDTLSNPLDESLALIGDGLGLRFDRTENFHEPYVSSIRREHAGRVVLPGRNAGFHKTSVGFRDGTPVVTIEMYGIFCIDPAVDAAEEGAKITIDGDTTIETEVRGNWFGDSYPVTAARAINAVGPLRRLPPGLYRPDQLAVCPR